MPQVSLLAKFRVHEGKGEELIAAFRTLFEQVEKEPGTVLYVMNRAKDDPDLFWFSELYGDDDAFAAHGSSDAMAKAMPTGPAHREVGAGPRRARLGEGSS